MESEPQQPEAPADESTESAVAAPKRRLNRPLLFSGAGVVFAALVVYGIDLYSTSGETQRGATVLGIDVSGISPAAAQEKLEHQFPGINEKQVSLRGGETTVEFTPSAAGLAIDWKATAESAADQSYNPFKRLFAWFSDHDVAPVQSVDEAKFAPELDRIISSIDREQVQGGIVFQGSVPEPIYSVPGQKLDAAKLRPAIQDGWPKGSPVDLPMADPGPLVSDLSVKKNLREIAQPAAAADLIVKGEKKTDAVLRKERIGDVLSFKPDGEGGLKAVWSLKVAEKILGPQLAKTEQPAREATVVIRDNKPVVVDEQTGRTVDWNKTLKNIGKDMLKPKDRVITATYGVSNPKFKRADAEKLGIKEVIGEFTTGGFEYASGINIGRAAEQVNGAVVKPGKTFSLNTRTGPRGTEQGYVESGVIINGRPGRGVGGGVSQFATTLYNAGYFAGMDDIEHREHSYYISRYPMAREATVWEGAIDVKFRNPDKTGVLIQSFADDSSVTVRLWGTKTVEVESINNGTWSYTSPGTIRLPQGPDCAASGGQDGFTTSDTRVIRDAKTGKEKSKSTHHRHLPADSGRDLRGAEAAATTSAATGRGTARR